MQRRFVTSVVVLILGVHSADVVRGQAATTPAQPTIERFSLPEGWGLAEVLKKFVDSAQKEAADTKKAMELIKDPAVEAFNAAAQAKAEQKRVEADTAEKLAKAWEIDDQVTAASANAVTRWKETKAKGITTAEDFIKMQEAAKKTAKDRHVTAEIRLAAAMEARKLAEDIASKAAEAAKQAREAKEADEAEAKKRAALCPKTAPTARASTRTSSAGSTPAIRPNRCEPPSVGSVRQAAWTTCSRSVAPPKDETAAKKLANSFVEKGECLLAKRLPGPAYNAFQDALTYQPDHVGAWIGQAKVFAAQNDENGANAAIIHYNKALEKDRDCREALLGRGRLQLSLARRKAKPDDLIALQDARNIAQAAAFDLGRAVQLDPHDDKAVGDYRDAQALWDYADLLREPGSTAPAPTPPAAAVAPVAPAAPPVSPAPPADDPKTELDKAKEAAAALNRQAKAAAVVAKKYADVAKAAEEQLAVAKEELDVAKQIAADAKAAVEKETDPAKKKSAEDKSQEADKNVTAKENDLKEATQKEQSAKETSAAAKKNLQAKDQAAQDANDKVQIKQAAYDKSEKIKEERAKAKEKPADPKAVKGGEG